VRALSAPEFNARVVPALSEREAENGLPFGIAQRLPTQPKAAPDALPLGVEVDLPHASNPRDWASATIASGSAFLCEDATAGCMACLSRETPNGRAIGPVYTPPAARRRGYATSLVAELSRHVLTSGKRFACLFTDDANPTSNHIYESIGFCFVCRYDAYSLVPPVE
jgi:hypothetical protein